jgi:diguanylate cyclase (GGDEF)-like protein/putative nucleotidyltransferase with HDIG domain
MEGPDDGGFRGLPARARWLIAAVTVAALAAAAALTLTGVEPPLEPWLLVVLGVACATASLVEVFAPGSYSLQPNVVFFAWGAVALPAWALVVLATICFAPPVLIRGARWYKTAFNWSDYVLAGSAAHAITRTSGFPASLAVDGRVAVLLCLGAVAFVVVNHGVLALMMSVALERSPARALAALAPAMPVDLAMALSGVGIAVLWTVAPGLALLGAGPLVLTYVALRIPALEHRSRTDPKTGLFNSEHFQHLLADALAHAESASTPVSLVMFDLDRLRAINNRFGHLAGDEAIIAFARVLAQHAEPGGIAARFGGEEFALLLPGMSAAEARARALAVRSQLEEVSLPWSTADAGLPFTVSAGVAAYPDQGTTPTRLLEAADGALYNAKIGGRDRVRLASEAASGDKPAPPRSRPDAILASAAARLAGAPVALEDAAAVEPEAAQEPAAPPHRVLPWFVALLALGALAVAIGASPDRIAAAPVWFALLVVTVFALDGLSVDLFERGNVSPGSVGTLALAFMFGPLGPLAAELAVAVKRIVARDPAVRWIFDIGALGLAGAAAAGTFELATESAGLGVLLASLLGAASYYVVNVSLLAVVMALNEHRDPFGVWRERLAWLAPQYVAFGLLAGGLVLTHEALGAYALLIFAVPVLTLVVVERQYVSRSRSSVDQLRRRQAELEGANQRLRELLERNDALLRGMHRSYLSTITSLARTIEAKDPYTGGHTERVAEFACALASELGISGPDLDAIEVGGVIHDIGKVGIPDAVLLKPDRLTEDEFAEMRRHPTISSYILAELDLPQIVHQMARSHHERFDGTGYPDRLAGEDIPLVARILSVADALDAMTSDRPYRAALPVDVALREITAQAGSQFCPRVVDALLACVDRDPTLGRRFVRPTRAEAPASR